VAETLRAGWRECRGAVGTARRVHSPDFRPSLFDNYIGRKRDVDGGFLAGSRCRLVSRERDLATMGPEEILTVTFRNSSRRGAGLVERRETGRRADVSWRMCLELVKNEVRSRGWI
jgi:hypothetical protein